MNVHGVSSQKIEDCVIKETKKYKGTQTLTIKHLPGLLQNQRTLSEEQSLAL
jgi:hypothetical protein